MYKSRVAVTAYFFLIGFLNANWASRIPELEDWLSISHADLGTFLFLMAAGATVALPLSGWVSSTFGSRQMVRWSGLFVCAMLPGLLISQEIWAARMAFILLGFGSGLLDVSMNDQAVMVEKGYQRPIMSMFHAFYSVGMAVGAGAGALFSNAQIPLTTHFLAVGISLIVIILPFSFYLDSSFQRKEKSAEEKTPFVFPAKEVIPLGLIAFCSMLSEGAMSDWSALFMSEVLQQPGAIGGLALGSFATAMTVGRFFGDKTRQKLGTQATLRYCSLLAVSGLAIVLFSGVAVLALLGFFLCGLGLSIIVPVAYSLSGNIPGIRPAAGIAMVSTISYAGFFLGPPSIGYLSEKWGLQIGFGVTLIVLLLMFGLIIARKEAAS